MAKNEKNIAKEEKVVDPKVQARKDARTAAKARIVTFLKDNAEQLGALKADIEMFIGKGGTRTARVVSKSVNAELRDAFLAKGSLT
jgi:nitrous oxide reductase